MSGTDWTVPGQGALLSRLRELAGQAPTPNDGTTLSDLNLTGEPLSEWDRTRIKEVLLYPELHSGLVMKLDEKVMRSTIQHSAADMRWACIELQQCAEQGTLDLSEIEKKARGIIEAATEILDQMEGRR